MTCYARTTAGSLSQQTIFSKQSDVPRKGGGNAGRAKALAVATPAKIKGGANMITIKYKHKTANGNWIPKTYTTKDKNDFYRVRELFFNNDDEYLLEEVIADDYSEI